MRCALGPLLDEWTKRGLASLLEREERCGFGPSQKMKKRRGLGPLVELKKKLGIDLSWSWRGAVCLVSYEAEDEAWAWAPPVARGEAWAWPPHDAGEVEA